MAFDAGFVTAVIDELNQRVIGSKIEKIFQPDKETIVLSLHCPIADGGDTVRLIIDVGSSTPRVHLTQVQYENPKVPPMYCMLLRKWLTGAKLTEITQPGFERVIILGFEARDEIGFTSNKYLAVEIMGKCSNLIFLDSDKKIISPLKTVDFTTSRVRQVLPGMKYELPPSQEGKVSPLDVDEKAFISLLNAHRELPSDKFIMQCFYGVSPLIAREIHSLCLGSLWNNFCFFRDTVTKKTFTPTLIKKPDGTPIEYSFLPITQYGDSAVCENFDSFGKLCDKYFGERSKNDRMKQRSSDILKLLTNAESRLVKKIHSQEQDLADCAQKEDLKRNGDLITSNLYHLKRGMTEVELIDYSKEDMPTVTLKLDEKMTPAQNAQIYYKKYNKSKTAEVMLRKQIELARDELSYINTVFESLTKAESENDLDEIRRELYESGYASKMKNYSLRKQVKPAPLEFMTSGGYKVLCGKNNAQNDYITHHVASKGDLWFHVKDMPGSHVILLCDGDEPSEVDFTEAAVIAAYYSKANKGQKVEVDYTRVKNIKKPPASKPGYVTFSQNYSAYVSPDADLVERLSCKKK